MKAEIVFMDGYRETYTFREFSKRRNDRFDGSCLSTLFWIGYAELPADFSGQKIRNLGVTWHRGDPARVG